MIITNQHNLPQAYVDAAKDTHKIEEKHYSVTTLLLPIREIMLKRRHDAEIEQDVSDMVWTLFGSAVHKIIEEADKTGYVEIELSRAIIEDYILTGICDYYNEKEFAVEDHKVTSVTKILRCDFEDWKKQGLMYAWMLRKLGHHVARLRFHALMKDWSAREKRQAEYTGKWYPEHPIWTWQYDVTEDDIKNIEKFVEDKFKELIKYESVADDELPICSKEERWNSGDKFRVFKQGHKKAIKICNDREEAEELAKANDAEIEEVKGEDRKCKDYCSVCKFCKYWRENIK